jgi:molecular chaperone DnaJ
MGTGERQREDLEAPIDWYAVLGVAPDAADGALREAWRELARRWHPDRAGNGAAARHRFELVQAAWGALGDAERRAAHDATRARFADRVAPLPAGIIERTVGVRRPDLSPGRNRRCRLTVEAFDVITGCQRTLLLPGEGPCGDCGGSGLAPLGRPHLCTRCGGRCFVAVRPVLRAVGEPCPACDAAGWEPHPACAGCGGSGRREVEVSLTVEVPAGAKSGAIITVPGHGERGRGGAPAGDLEVQLDVASGGPYKVRGKDWEAEVEIPFWRALVGGPHEVRTPWGARVVKLPPRTEAGELLCLSGLGVGREGDGYLRVRVRWPEDLSSEEMAELVAWGEKVEGRRTGAGR